MATSNNEEQKNPSQFSSSGDENNLEDTKPRRIRPVESEDHLAATSPTPVEHTVEPAVEPAVEPTDALSETRPVTLSRQTESDAAEIFDADLSQTRPTAVGDETFSDELPPGFEQTIPPPPAFFENEPVSAFDATPLEPLPSDASDVPPTQSITGNKKPAVGSRKKKSASTKSARRLRNRWFLIPVLGLLAILLVGVLSAFGGYFSGIDLRQSAESTQMVQEVEHQFQLGLQDLMEGKYDYARQRFEHVLRLNPGYPGATEKLAEALSYLNATATPTQIPTPTLTPTPDTRANEELFSQGQQAIVDGNWDVAVNTLLSLRQNDPNYRLVEIDGMLFMALRNRGREKIVQSNLESGIYDLTLAANFAPLDSEAQGLLNWSQLYITGASFWEIDWAQVVQYFSEIAPQMPNLMDSSGITASERYRQGLFNYGNQLAAEGKACQAVDMYEQSLQVGPAAEVQTAYEQAVKACSGGGEGGGSGEGTPKPGKKKTPTVEPPVEPPPPVP